MKRVLRRLEFTTKEDIVQIKGKVACEISACDEIMITELMFSGLFNEMENNEIAAVLSCLVHDESAAGSEKGGIKNENLAKFYAAVLDQGRRIAKIYNESKINIDEVEKGVGERGLILFIFILNKCSVPRLIDKKVFFCFLD